MRVLAALHDSFDHINTRFWFTIASGTHTNTLSKFRGPGTVAEDSETELRLSSSIIRRENEGFVAP